MQRLKRVFSAAIFVAAALPWVQLSLPARPAGAQAVVPAQTYRTLPINVIARPAALQSVVGDDGRRVIAYNLIVTNWSEQDLTLREIDVEDVASGATLTRYDEKALEDPFRQRITRLAAGEASPRNRVLPAGRSSFVTVGIVLAGDGPVPVAVRHRILFEPIAGTRIVRDDGTLSDELVAVSDVTRISPAPAVVIGPPLRGGPWRCGNGLGYRNGHSAAYTFRTADLRVPQRFGCDFAKIDAGGNTLPSPFPDTIDAKMFYGYGLDVLAVADGTIAFAKGDVPEGIPQVDGSIKMAVPLTNDTVSGNWIALDLGDGHFVFYAHLQPGSVRVRTGDRVRRGQVLGSVGMSGNAVGPHLHFHVGDSPSLNGTTALPYVFDRFVFAGRGRPQATAIPVRERLPLEDAVVIFP